MLTLNTIYHSKEDIAMAEFYINESMSQEEANTYASILIFSKFDVEKADKYYAQLLRDGILYACDVGAPGGRLLGWELPFGIRDRSEDILLKSFDDGDYYFDTI